MRNLSKHILAEKENVEKTIAYLVKALENKDKSTVEVAGIATFLHNIYNGVENILKQILIYRNIKIDQAEGWHKALLECSISNGIIQKELSDKLYEYLTFRHFFIHSYGFRIDEARLISLTF